MVLVTADVVARKLGSPITGAIEVTEFLMVPLVFLALAYVQSQKGHIRVGIVIERIKRPVLRKGLEILALIVGIGIFAVLFWYALEKTIDLYKVGEYSIGLIHFPLWPAWATIPVGSLIFCVQLFLDIFEVAKSPSFTSS